MKSFFIFIITIFLLISCQNSNHKEQVKNYIDYQTTRKNIAQFLSLYDEKIQYEDISFKDKKVGKEMLKAKFEVEWNDSLRTFHESYPKAISVENVFYDNDKVIIKGMILPFYYNKNLIEHKRFITCLYFNDKGKIIKQEDWIDYPAQELLQVYQMQQNLENATLSGRME